MNTEKQNYIKAYNNLIEAEKYDLANEIYIDGYIKRYELCFDLAIKALKEYFIKEGNKEEECIEPKSILGVAFESKVIDNEELWNDMLKIEIIYLIYMYKAILLCYAKIFKINMYKSCEN